MDSRNNTDRAKRYSAWKTRLFLFDMIVSFTAILVFQVFFSRMLAGAVSGLNINFYAALGIYVTVFLFFLYMVSLPAHYLSSFVMEHRYSLSKQTIKAWAIDEIKSSVISFTILFFGVQVLYVFLRNSPDYWWILAAGSWILFSVILARFMPVLLLPLFYKYSSIEDASLKDRIISLARRANLELVDVCQIDLSRKTAKSNAALIGLGKTRKVILADNLINEFEGGEIGSVVAHEFGHYRYKHIWRLLLFSAFSTVIGFFMLSAALDSVLPLTGASGHSDIRLLPLMVLFFGIMNFLLLPLQNYYSRCLERQADRFSLNITGDAGCFISTMNKLAKKNLADTAPSIIKKIFFYTHPPICERIKMAEKYK